MYHTLKTNLWKLHSFIIIGLLFILSTKTIAQTVTITAPVASATYCAGTNVTVNYTVTSAFGAGNVFTTQLSDALGSFTSPTTIGTRTATTSGGSACLIPFSTVSGSLYRIRVLSSNPTFTSQSNGVNLTINALALNTPTVPLTSYCINEVFNVTFTQNCAFAAGNIYSVQLSDASGSFAAPTTIGTRAATTAAAISCTIPSVPAGSGYRIRIVSSNPVLTSADNGLNITIGATVGNPAVFGSNMWKVYCYNTPSYNSNYTLFNYSNYRGMYTESTLNTNSLNFFTADVSPSSAPNYSGCPVTNDLHIVNYKRQGFTCGYYQINIAGTDGSAGFDDGARLIIDGNVVWFNTGCCAAANNVWQGFLGPNSQVDFAWAENGGQSYGKLTFLSATVNPISMSAPATICSGSSTTLTATNTSSLNFTYSWLPVASLSPTTGSVVIASPTVSTNYTVVATDAVSTCTISNTVSITVNPLPTTTTSIVNAVTCFGLSTATITASGANTYTWSPPDGLNTISGNVVVASPSVTTTYTVLGSNNCSVVASVRTVSVQTVPSTPSPTVYGSGTWNVYCYNDNNAFTNYYGYYTEDLLSFNTRNRWNQANGPSTCTTTATGLSYSGCNIPSSPWSMSFRRTNIPCGYYQIDLLQRDDNLRLFINGTQVSTTGCCGALTNFWTGFIGPSTLVEFRLVNTGGPGDLNVKFTPVSYPVLSPPVTICAGTSTSLTASPFISGATYSWTPSASLSPASGTLVVASPTIGTSYTCTVTDPVTTCSASASVSITVDPLPSTTVSPTSATIACAAQSRTLTAGGANTYSWSPSAGLNTTIGSSVIATPSVTTIYTVTGNNNCADVIATTTITVLPLISSTVFPTGTWNVYAFNSTNFTNYHGYYTENGSGASGCDFNTTTKWLANAAPSTANATNGSAYQGCTMPTTNWTMSFKRTGFVCGTYTVVANRHDDPIVLLIDGVQVASRNGSGSAANLWIGVLNPNSEVEFRYSQGGGNADLRVTFNIAAPTASLSTWIGAVSTDWFNAANWCGSGVPNSTIDVLIPNSKPQFMPVIASPGAACRSLTITAAQSAVSSTVAGTPTLSALPAASLTINAGNSLDVYGNWINNGFVNASSTSTVNILGTTSTSLAGSATETIGVLVVNKTGTVTIPASKVVQIANNMTFTNGIVNQNATLRFLNGSDAIGANNNSYVNGQVIKVGTQAFTFPVGAGGFYRPISITAPGVATDNFTARYILADPSPSFTHTSKDASIDHVGRCEYWILDRTGGSSNVSVTLSWNTTSCGVTNLADLLVARWDSGQNRWKDEGNGGTTGSTAAGTIITSAPVTLFSPFTLASSTSNNPLPIELVSFSCSNNKNINSLSWVTASEVNNDYFSIERSFDGINFEQVAKQKGAGNSVTSINYTYKDQSLYNGISYYRLKQVDFNGKYTYSEICSVNNNSDGNLIFYPNPVKNTLTVDYEFAEKPSSTVVSVTDLTGKVVDVNVSYINSKITLDCSKLEEGIYFLKVIIAGKEVVSKFTVQK